LPLFISITLAALVAPELQFAVLSLNVPPKGGSGIKTIGTSLLSAHVSCHIEMGRPYMSLESLMLPEALVTSFVASASEALGAFVNCGMSS
jgi:hypothetical protein